MSTVLVMVGTDHHPFHRLVDCADDLAAEHPGCRVVVQHGATSRPAIAEGHAFVPRDDLQALLREADVVVCHGGPGTIMDARDAGHAPIVLPRDPAFREHVDGHQQRFVRLLASTGIVTACWSTEEVRNAVADGLVERRRAPATDSGATGAARAAVARELDRLAGRERLASPSAPGR